MRNTKGIKWLREQLPEPKISSDYYNFYNDYCKTFGAVKNETFHRYCRAAFDLTQSGREEKVKLLENEEGLTASMVASDIKTEEDLIRFGNIDTEKWQATELTNEFWGSDTNPNYLIKCKFKRRSKEDLTPRQYADKFLGYLGSYKPPKAIKKAKNKDAKYMTQINLADFHLGQCSWAAETGSIDYDVDVAKKLFLETVDYFIEETSGYTHKYLLPIGNDFFNVDSKFNTTTKGTFQVETPHHNKTFIEAEELLINVIDKLDTIAEVEVVIVSGNHDEQRMFYIGEFLRAFYRSRDTVSIDNSPTPRKYVRYGNSMIMFTHGNAEVKGYLPLLLAQERPMDFAETKFREIHLAHLHTSSDRNFRLVKESQGIREIVLPSLIPLDDWHKKKGYISVTEATAFVWDKSNGKKMTIYYHPSTH